MRCPTYPKIRESGSCTDLLSYSIVSKNTRELVHARLVQQDIDREGSEKSPKLFFFANRKTGILTGKPNPLTPREIIDHCVIYTYSVVWM